MKKILFDSGHYKNYNQSSVYKTYFEGNQMWKLHLYVKDYLEKNYKVLISTTRSRIEQDKDLYQRGQMAKGFDGFYSFHSNASTSEKTDRVVIIRSLSNKVLNSYCEQLGDGIKGVMGLRDKTQVYERDNGKKGEWYGVLRGASSVGCVNRFIIEHSFHTNKDVAIWLSNDENLRKLAKVEGDIIAKFHKLDRIDNVKMIKIKEDVNYRWKADFSKDEYVKGLAKKGEVFTVVERVKSNCSTDMYRLKSGYYITTNSKYVDVYK